MKHDIIDNHPPSSTGTKRNRVCSRSRNHNNSNTSPFMNTPSYVWVQLYYKGKDEPEGQAIKIKPAPEDVADLKAAVLPELGPALLGKVTVYAPDTKRPFSQDKAIDPGDDVPPGTTSKNPLIVVAPQQPHQQAVVADATSTLASLKSMLPALAETTVKMVFEKMEIASSSISFSTVKTKQYEKVANLLRFKIKGAVWKRKGHIPETNTELHTWLDGNEDSPENIKEYMNYINVELKLKFRWKDEHEYVDCNEKGAGLKSLLDTHHFDGQHSTSGNIDVVLVESADKAAMAIKNNIELGLALKHTKNQGEHERQVILQHLVASFLNHEYPVLTLMTDLRTRFTFYWFGKNEKVIWKYKASIAEAMYLLDHIFVKKKKSDAGSGDGDEEETFPIDFLFDERGTWESFNTIKIDTIQEKENEEGSGNNSDADHEKEEEETAGRKRDNAGNLVGEKKEQMHQNTSSSGGRCIGNNYKPGQEDLSDVLGFDTLEEHEKGEAVLEYLACNVLPNVVLT